MGLYDWYTTAKKKLEDGLGAAGNVAQQTAGTIGGAFNSGVSRLGSLADQARNTIASTVSNDVNGVKNYFNNDATAGGILKNTFSPSSLSDSLMNAPEHTFANDISWSNPVQKLGAEIAQGTANTFHGVRDYAKEAANQYYGNTPQDTGKLVGLGGKAALNLAGLGFGGSKVASLAKDSLEVPAAKGMAGVGQAMWQGAKSSVAPGALFGGAYGLADSVQNHQSLPETAANTALSAGSGALFAGGLGSAISGVAPLAKVAVQEGRNIKADLFNLPKAARTITTPVTTETIPAHYVKAGEQPGIVQGLPGEIRTALFPKPSSGEQYGAVRPTGKNTAYQTPGVTRDVMAPVPAQTVTRGGTTVRPFEPQSGLFQWMQKPVLGNSIEDVSRTTKNPNQGDLFSGGARPGSYSHSDIPVVSQSVPPSSVLAPGRNAGMSGLSADQPPLMPVSPGKPLQISSPELGKTPTGNGKIPYTGQSGLDTTTLPNPQQIASDATRALQGAQVKERGFITSVKTGEKTPNAVKQGLAGDYSVLSNEERIALARKAIQDNPEQALKQATNPQSAHDVTIGNQLLDSYIANGQFDKVSALTSRMAEGGQSSVGQSRRSRIMTRPTPPEQFAGRRQKSRNTIERIRITHFR